MVGQPANRLPARGKEVRSPPESLVDLSGGVVLWVFVFGPVDLVNRMSIVCWICNVFEFGAFSEYLVELFAGSVVGFGRVDLLNLLVVVVCIFLKWVFFSLCSS